MLSRPFKGRPDAKLWDAFLQHIAELTTEQGYTLVVFDSLPNLWWVRDENDAALAEIAALVRPARLGVAGRLPGATKRRKASHLRLVKTESEEFAASVERDLAELPTIEEKDRR